MGIRVGIDLGTTYSVVAYVNPETNKAEVIPNKYGKRVTPSAIAFLEDGTVLFGEDALDYKEACNTEFVSFFKRFMGNSDYRLLLKGEEYSAARLTGMLLKELVAEAEEVSGKKVEEAVITVPAYFRHKERQATLDAAAYAGIVVKNIINEPTAAAFAYGIHGRKEKKHMLIYDLGGGTFDVALAKITDTQIEILGSDGNHELGGKEWDDVIARYFTQCFMEEFGLDLSEEEECGQKVSMLSEQVKRKLSVASVAWFHITYQGHTGKYQLTREALEGISSTLLDITKDTIHRLLASLSMSVKEVDGVLLVGGSTKMSMVREYMEQTLQLNVVSGVNPEEAVALGAAIYANGQEEVLYLPGQKKVLDSISHSLGMLSISVDGNWYVNSILIPKHSRLPASKTRTFSYVTKEADSELEVYLLQGEGKTPEECEVVGKYVFTGMEHIREHPSMIYITYTYNTNGLIEVSGVQSETNKELEVRVEELPVDLSWMKQSPVKSQRVETTLNPGVVYVVIDLSGSMAGVPLAEAKMAIMEFVMQLDLNTFSVGIIGFADRVRILLEPTKDVKKLQRLIQSIHVSGRLFGFGNGVNPFAIIYEAFRTKKIEENVSKYAVILTDGVWSYQEYAIKEAKLCHDAGIEIFALGFGYADQRFLEQVASREDLAKLIRLPELTHSFTKIATAIREKSSRLCMMEQEE